MSYDATRDGGSGSRYLIKRPKALQWFDNGRLCKETNEERQAGRFELFLDLLYVAIVANFSDDLAEHPDGAHVAKYVLVFAPAWHIWSDLREMMNSYYTDDLVQRLTVLWVMAMLVLYANSANRVDEELDAMRAAAGAYVAARGTTVIVLLVSSAASYQHRAQSRLLACLMIAGLVASAPLFLARISIGAKAAVAAVLIAYQEAAWILAAGTWIKRHLRLRYSTAVDITHEIDRMAAFFIIILGEFLYSVVVGDPAGVGLTPGYAKAVATLVVAFCINWLYVSGDGSLRATHPIRRSVRTAFAFFTLHLPMSASFLIGGHVAAAGARLDRFEEGQRWLLGGGLGVGTFCLWAYALLFRSEDESCLVMRKSLRIGMRPVVATILVLLPLAREALEGAAEFMAVVVALYAFLTVWETVGGLAGNACFFEPWEGRHPPVDGGGDNAEGSGASGDASADKTETPGC